MSESAGKVLSEMAKITGLNRETIKDLMKKGWTYETHVNEPARFVHPSSRLQR